MKFISLSIPDVILIQPRVFYDTRGFFYESYSRAIFEANGIKDDFVQDNMSKSCRGVLRGLHYQLPPRAQAKLVRVLRGSVLDVAVDIRRGSETFGQHVAHVLTGDSKEMLYIPAGFAHGFCVLDEEAEFHYKVSDFYSPAHDRGILWSDLDLGIVWPSMDYIVSEKDQKHPLLSQTPASDLF